MKCKKQKVYDILNSWLNETIDHEGRATFFIDGEDIREITKEICSKKHITETIKPEKS